MLDRRRPCLPVKKLLILFLLAYCSAGCSAASAPVVGIWSWKPVVEADASVAVRTSYIFTEQALSERTVFSALHDNTDGYSVICCLEVTDLTPLDPKALITKYQHDPDFVQQIGSIKGAPFMYEALPVARKDLSPWLATLTDPNRHPSDTSPFHAPVISGRFVEKDIPHRFVLGGTTIKLKNTINRQNERMTYEFSIGKRVVRLSEHVDLGD
jgi:hypothetical protein